MTDGTEVTEKTGERLKNLIARFVLKYNYWGFLFSRIRRQPAPIPSIMGVAPVVDGTICLYYNPPLVDATDDQNLIKVIEHEGLHVLNKHIPRLIRILAYELSDESKKRKAEVWNISADCSVNNQASYSDSHLRIAEMDWPVLYPSMYKLPDDKTTEWYYLELLKQQKKKGKGQKGEGSEKGLSQSGDGQPIGDHGKWLEECNKISDLSSLSRKVDQHIRRLIKESVKHYNKERGRLPANIAALIEGALEPPKAPYYQIIQKLIKASRFSKFRSSPTRVNRKRTYTFVINEKDKLPQISPFPGKTRDYTFNIVVLIDTSGSMSNDDIKEGLSGVRNIIEKDRYCFTTVLEVDAGVEKEYECRKVSDIQFEIKGRGGTTLGPGLFRAAELNCDVCLAFTDGYTENINQLPRKKLPKRTIWVINKGGSVENVNKTGFIVQL